MKKFRKALAFMLALCMVFSLVPGSVAADEVADNSAVATAADETGFQKIVHLDCGRKYFTKEWIIALINEMAADGYTHLQLAFGNDGMRFLLDDMSVTVNGTTYSSADVTAGIQAGNEAYYDAGDKNELTQSEMDEIITAADKAGISIVPHLNMPGHMDAIVDTIESVGISDGRYSSSARSINLESEEAVGFSHALLEKYVSYFAAKGCKYFHIGADEYANDTSLGFENMGATLYGKFAEFVNEAASIVKAGGMTPRAWNDGISYKDYSEEFDTDIQITYWSSGWWGYDVAAASTLSNNGHDMINTHGDYYYILGVNDTYTSGTTATHVGYDYTKAESFSNTTFMGGTISDPVGSMFCIWADYPGAETETEVSKYIRPILRVMSASMDGTTDYEVDSVVSGGFNADGTINTDSTGEEGGDVETPDTPELIILTDNGVSVTAYDLTGLTVTVLDTPAYTAKDGESVIGYDIAPETAEGAYSGEASVEITLPAEWTNGTVSVYDAVKVENVSCTVSSGVVSFTATHFSEYDIVYAADTTGEDGGLKDTVTSTNSGTKTTYQLATSITTDKSYIIVNSNKNYALMNNNGTAARASVSVNGDELTLGDGVDVTNLLWTFTQPSGWNYVISNGNQYINLGNKDILSTDSQGLTVYSFSDGYFWIYRESNPYYYLRYNSGWERNRYNNNTNLRNVYLYEEVTESTDVWTIDAALQESRIKNLTVANDGYTDDSWATYQTALKAAQAKLTEVEKGPYTSEDKANTALNELIAAVDALETAKNNLTKPVPNVDITINYIAKEEDGTETVIKTETKSVPGNSTTVILTSPIYDDDGNRYVLDSTTLNLKLPVTDYEVYVTYTSEDLDSVEPLVIEYWITNARLVGTVSNMNYVEVSATDSGVFSENGVAVSTLVDANGTTGGRTQVYWRSTLLDVEEANNSTSSTEQQTELSGDDETLNGDVFTHIRYWGGMWQVLVGKTWTEVNRSEVTVTVYDTKSEIGTEVREKNQLVAYYMEVVNFQNENGTTELEVNTADWGKYGNGTVSNDYLEPNATVSVSVQIIYEDGSGNPANAESSDYPSLEELREKTVVYGYWTDGRGLGTMVFTGGDQFQIYRITAETGAHTIEGSTWSGVTITGFTWDDNAKTVWKGDPASSVSIGNPARAPKTEDPYDNLMWDENKEAILIRVYVKSVQADDIINVHYMDRSANDIEFYTYSIPVESDIVFDSGFAMGTATNTLVNNTVTNYYGTTQTVSAELSEMPQIAAYYRYCKYTLVEAVRSEDGKDVYLYYTFTPVVSFVADFGLPIEITPSDLNQDGYSTSGFEIKAVKVIGSYDTEASDTANSAYGTLSVSGTTVTYTLNEILDGIDFFTIFVQTGSDGVGIAYRVYVGPATTVYYEETFTDDGCDWTVGGSSLGLVQSADKAGEAASGTADNYGYDASYAGVSEVGATNGTYITSNAVGDDAVFSFTGTGFDLYAVCKPGDMAVEGSGASGVVSVFVRKDDQLVKIFRVNTATGEAGTATTGQAVVSAALPIVSFEGEAHGNYEVTVRHTPYYVEGGTVVNPVYIDGIRVYDTILDAVDSFYSLDNESDPNYTELRNHVLAGMGVANVTGSQYYDKNSLVTAAGQVYNAADGAGAVLLDDNAVLGTTVDVKDLLDNGPKNELFLRQGETVTFKLAYDINNVQLGLKSVNAAAKVTVKCGNTTVINGRSLTTSADMFYALGDVAGQVVTVTNSGSGILSVTDLKYFGTPSSTQSNASTDGTDAVATASEEATVASPFAVMSEEDYRTAFRMIGMLTAAEAVPEVPEVPEVPVVPEEPEVPEVPEDTQPPVTEDTTTEGTEGDETEPPEVDEEETTKPNKPGKEDKPNKPNKPGKEDKPNKNEKPNNSNKPGKNDKTDKNDQSQSSSRPSYNMSTVTDTVKSIVSMLSSLVNYLMFR